VTSAARINRVTTASTSGIRMRVPSSRVTLVAVPIASDPVKATATHVDVLIAVG
jgi:hypothetical protein